MSEKAIEKFRAQVRELWDHRQNRTSNQLRDPLRRYLRGWWEYYRLAGNRKLRLWMDGWIRRHMRKCFWQRWHGSQGRVAALKKLGV